MKALTTVMILGGLLLMGGAAGAIERDTVQIGIGILIALAGLALLLGGGWLARRIRS